MPETVIHLFETVKIDHHERCAVPPGLHFGNRLFGQPENSVSIPHARQAVDQGPTMFQRNVLDERGLDGVGRRRLDFALGQRREIAQALQFLLATT